MKKTAIISAMWVEAEKLHMAMEQDTVEEYEYNGMKFYEGKLCGCDVVLSTCGVGKINAAIYTQLMIDKFAPDEIIHTGIAGSLDPAVKHLDVVIADGDAHEDYAEFEKKASDIAAEIVMNALKKAADESIM